MFSVIFYEKGDLVLSQLLKTVPEEGAEVKIKGLKRKIINVNQMKETTFHVQVETIVKEISKKR